jgi:hypothetical protein
MRLVVVTATLLTLWLGLPGRAAAQEPDPPPPPPPQTRAVPRSERIVVRDTETRSRDTTPENRTPSRGADRAPVREPEPARAASTASGDAGRSDNDEQRRGAVRRPPAGGSGSSGGSSGSGASSGSGSGNSGRSRGADRAEGDSRRGGTSGVAVDRAVPRSSVPRPSSRVYVYPDYYRNYNRYYDPWGYGSFGLGYFYYSPWGWDPDYYSGYGSGYGYSSGYGYGSGYGSGYGYGMGGGRYSAYGFDIGSLKLKVKPRDAEVYVDGYFAGYVDDFDGILQSLKIDAGAHRIEIRKAGYETLNFDVRVQPERSITFRGEMRPVP